MTLFLWIVFPDPPDEFRTCGQYFEIQILVHNLLRTEKIPSDSKIFVVVASNKRITVFGVDKNCNYEVRETSRSTLERWHRRQLDGYNLMVFMVSLSLPSIHAKSLFRGSQIWHSKNKKKSEKTWERKRKIKWKYETQTTQRKTTMTQITIKHNYTISSYNFHSDIPTYMCCEKICHLSLSHNKRNFRFQLNYHV